MEDGRSGSRAVDYAGLVVDGWVGLWWCPRAKGQGRGKGLARLRKYDDRPSGEPRWTGELLAVNVRGP